MKVKINDIEYFVEQYQKESDLPALLLLHGFMGSGRVFSSLMDHLASFCNPVTIDLLGHGKTKGANSFQRFSKDRQIDDLHQIITRLFDAPPFLHGYSMGGRLALRYALDHPQDLQGLILESTNYGLEDLLKINQRKQTDEERARAIENDFASFLEEWKTLPIFQNGISMPQKKLDKYYTIQRQQDATQMAHSLRGFGTAQMPGVKEQLAELNLPVLLLAGQADLKYAEIARHMYKLIPGSTLSIISNAGHRVHFEHAKAFVAAIKTFINKEQLL